MTDVTKNFKVPKIKRQESKDNLRNVDLKSRDAKDLVNVVARSYVERSYSPQWQLRTVQLVEHKELEEAFRQKRVELKDDGRHARDLVDQYAFLLFRDSYVVQKVVRGGLLTRALPFNGLGSSKLGVYLCRNADVQLRLADSWGIQTCVLIVFKVILGKCKVLANTDNTDDSIEPTPNYDCHISQVQAKPSDPLHIQLVRSQIYLYEYNDDCEPATRPRQCLPYAILAYDRQTAGESSGYGKRSTIPPTVSTADPGQALKVKRSASYSETTVHPGPPDVRTRADPALIAKGSPDVHGHGLEAPGSSSMPKPTDPRLYASDPALSAEKSSVPLDSKLSDPRPQDPRLRGSYGSPNDPSSNLPVDPRLHGKYGSSSDSSVKPSDPRLHRNFSLPNDLSSNIPSDPRFRANYNSPYDAGASVISDPRLQQQTFTGPYGARTSQFPLPTIKENATQPFVSQQIGDSYNFTPREPTSRPPVDLNRLASQQQYGQYKPSFGPGSSPSSLEGQNKPETLAAAAQRDPRLRDPRLQPRENSSSGSLSLLGVVDRKAEEESTRLAIEKQLNLLAVMKDIEMKMGVESEGTAAASSSKQDETSGKIKKKLSFHEYKAATKKKQDVTVTQMSEREVSNPEAGAVSRCEAGYTEDKDLRTDKDLKEDTDLRLSHSQADLDQTISQPAISGSYQAWSSDKPGINGDLAAPQSACVSQQESAYPAPAPRGAAKPVFYLDEPMDHSQSSYTDSSALSSADSFSNTTESRKLPVPNMSYNYASAPVYVPTAIEKLPEVLSSPEVQKKSHTVREALNQCDTGEPVLRTPLASPVDKHEAKDSPFSKAIQKTLAEYDSAHQAVERPTEYDSAHQAVERPTEYDSAHQAVERPTDEVDSGTATKDSVLALAMEKTLAELEKLENQSEQRPAVFRGETYDYPELTADKTVNVKGSRSDSALCTNQGSTDVSGSKSSQVFDSEDAGNLVIDLSLIELPPSTTSSEVSLSNNTVASSYSVVKDLGSRETVKAKGEILVIDDDSSEEKLVVDFSDSKKEVSQESAEPAVNLGPLESSVENLKTEELNVASVLVAPQTEPVPADTDLRKSRSRSGTPTAADQKLVVPPKEDDDKSSSTNTETKASSSSQLNPPQIDEFEKKTKVPIYGTYSSSSKSSVLTAGPYEEDSVEDVDMRPKVADPEVAHNVFGDVDMRRDRGGVVDVNSMGDVDLRSLSASSSQTSLHGSSSFTRTYPYDYPPTADYRQDSRYDPYRDDSYRDGRTEYGDYDSRYQSHRSIYDAHNYEYEGQCDSYERERSYYYGNHRERHPSYPDSEVYHDYGTARDGRREQDMETAAYHYSTSGRGQVSDYDDSYSYSRDQDSTVSHAPPTQETIPSENTQPESKQSESIKSEIPVPYGLNLQNIIKSVNVDLPDLKQILATISKVPATVGDNSVKTETVTAEKLPEGETEVNDSDREQTSNLPAFVTGLCEESPTKQGRGSSGRDPRKRPFTVDPQSPYKNASPSPGKKKAAELEDAEKNRESDRKEVEKEESPKSSLSPSLMPPWQRALLEQQPAIDTMLASEASLGLSGEESLPDDNPSRKPTHIKNLFESDPSCSSLESTPTRKVPTTKGKEPDSFVKKKPKVDKNMMGYKRRKRRRKTVMVRGRLVETDVSSEASSLDPRENDFLNESDNDSDDSNNLVIDLSACNTSSESTPQKSPPKPQDFGGHKWSEIQDSPKLQPRVLLSDCRPRQKAEKAKTVTDEADPSDVSASGDCITRTEQAPAAESDTIADASSDLMDDSSEIAKDSDVSGELIIDLSEKADDSDVPADLMAVSPQKAKVSETSDDLMIVSPEKTREEFDVIEVFSDEEPLPGMEGYVKKEYPKLPEYPEPPKQTPELPEQPEPPKQTQELPEQPEPPKQTPELPEQLKQPQQLSSLSENLADDNAGQAGSVQDSTSQSGAGPSSVKEEDTGGTGLEPAVRAGLNSGQEQLPLEDNLSESVDSLDSESKQDRLKAQKEIQLKIQRQLKLKIEEAKKITTSTEAGPRVEEINEELSELSTEPAKNFEKEEVKEVKEVTGLEELQLEEANHITSHEMQKMVEKHRKNITISLKGKSKKVVDPKTGKASAQEPVGSSIPVLGQRPTMSMTVPQSSGKNTAVMPTADKKKVNKSSAKKAKFQKGSIIPVVGQSQWSGGLRDGNSSASGSNSSSFRSPSPVAVIPTVSAGVPTFRAASPVNLVTQSMAGSSANIYSTNVARIEPVSLNQPYSNQSSASMSYGSLGAQGQAVVPTVGVSRAETPPTPTSMVPPPLSSGNIVQVPVHNQDASYMGLRLPYPMPNHHTVPPIVRPVPQTPQPSVSPVSPTMELANPTLSAGHVIVSSTLAPVSSFRPPSPVIVPVQQGFPGLPGMPLPNLSQRLSPMATRPPVSPFQLQHQSPLSTILLTQPSSQAMQMSNAMATQQNSMARPPTPLAMSYHGTQFPQRQIPVQPSTHVLSVPQASPIKVIGSSSIAVSCQQMPVPQKTQQQMPMSQGTQQQMSMPQQMFPLMQGTQQIKSSQQQIPFQQGIQQLFRPQGTQQMPMQQGTQQQMPMQQGTQQHNPMQQGTRQQMPMPQGTQQQMPMQQGTHQQMPMQQGTHQQMPMPQGTHQQMPMQQGTQQQMPMQQGTRQQIPMQQGTQQQMPIPQGTQQQMPIPQGTQQQMPMPQGTQQHMPMQQGTRQQMPMQQGTPQHNPMQQGTWQQMPMQQGTQQQMPTGTHQHMPMPQGSQQLMPMPQGTQQQMPMQQGTQQQMPMPQGTQQQMPMPQGTQQQMPMPQGTQQQMPIPQGTQQQMPMQQGTQQQMPMPQGTQQHMPMQQGTQQQMLIGTQQQMPRPQGTQQNFPSMQGTQELMPSSQQQFTPSQGMPIQAIGTKCSQLNKVSAVDKKPGHVLDWFEDKVTKQSTKLEADGQTNTQDANSVGDISKRCNAESKMRDLSASEIEASQTSKATSQKILGKDDLRLSLDQKKVGVKQTGKFYKSPKVELRKPQSGHERVPVSDIKTSVTTTPSLKRKWEGDKSETTFEKKLRFVLESGTLNKTPIPEVKFSLPSNSDETPNQTCSSENDSFDSPVKGQTRPSVESSPMEESPAKGSPMQGRLVELEKRSMFSLARKKEELIMALATLESSSASETEQKEEGRGDGLEDVSDLEEGELTDEDSDVQASPVKSVLEEGSRRVVMQGRPNRNLEPPSRSVETSHNFASYSNNRGSSLQYIRQPSGDFASSHRIVQATRPERSNFLEGQESKKRFIQAASEWSSMLQQKDSRVEIVAGKGKPPANKGKSNLALIQKRPANLTLIQPSVPPSAAVTSPVASTVTSTASPVKDSSDPSSGVLSSSAAVISKNRDKIIARSQVKTLGDWLKVELELQNVGALQKYLPYSLNTDFTTISKGRRRKIKTKVRTALDAENKVAVAKANTSVPDNTTHVTMECVFANEDGTKTTCNSAPPNYPPVDITYLPEVGTIQIQKELAMVKRAAAAARTSRTAALSSAQKMEFTPGDVKGNLSVTVRNVYSFAPRSVRSQEPGSDEELAFITALATVESEMKLMLQRTCFHGYPHRKVPSELILASERKYFKSEEEVFLILMMPISAKPYLKLKGLKTEIETLKAKLALRLPASVETSLRSQLKDLHQQRSSVFKSFTGFLNKKRIQKLQDLVNKYGLVYDHFKSQPQPPTGNRLQFLKTMLVDLKQHLLLARQYLALEESKVDIKPNPGKT